MALKDIKKNKAYIARQQGTSLSATNNQWSNSSDTFNSNWTDPTTPNNTNNYSAQDNNFDMNSDKWDEFASPMEWDPNFWKNFNYETNSFDSPSLGSSVNRTISKKSTPATSLYTGNTTGLKNTSTTGFTPTGYEDKSVFKDTTLWSQKTQYKWPWIKLSTGSTIENVKPWAMQEIPNEINVYGQNAKNLEAEQPWFIATRNDALKYNLKGQGVDTKQGIRDYLSTQPWFAWASAAEQQNTVDSIAAGMGIEKDSLTRADKIEKAKMDQIEVYKKEQENLQTEWDKQWFVKRMDNILGETNRELTPQEIQSLSDQSGLTPEEWQKTYEEWRQARDEVFDPFETNKETLTIQKDRAIMDANTQLDRDEQTVANSINDIETQTARDIAWFEKIGALKGYAASSGYQKGMNDVKWDSAKLIARLRTQLNNSEIDTAENIKRIWENYGRDIDAQTKQFTQNLLALKMAGTNQVNTLLTKYSPSDEFLTKELERLTEDYGMQSLKLNNELLDSMKKITDVARQETEKVQEYQTKQKELENLTLSYLYNNNWMALRNMSDAQIEQLYKDGNISAATVETLKAARDGAKQDLSLNQQQIDISRQNANTSQMNVENSILQDYIKNNPSVASTSNTKLNRGEQINMMKWLMQQYATSSNDAKGFAQGMSQIPDGITWGQCGAFSNDIAVAMGSPKLFGDTLKSKKDQVNTKTPTVGSFVVIDTGVKLDNGTPAGHVGYVTAVNNWQITIKDSNRAGNEKVSTHTMNANDPKIQGYVDMTKKMKPAPTITKEDSLPSAVDFDATDIEVFNSLTPSDKKKTQNDPLYNQFIDKKKEIMSNKDAKIEDILAYSAGGQPVNQTQEGQLSKLWQALNQIGDIQQLIKWQVTWPLIGKVKSMNPFDTDAQTLKAGLNALIPNLARWVYGEVWVLTDADVAQYAKTIPNLNSTQDVNKAVLAMTLKTIANGYKSKLQNMAWAGFDVWGMEWIYNNIMYEVDRINQELGINNNTWWGWATWGTKKYGRW